MSAARLLVPLLAIAIVGILLAHAPAPDRFGPVEAARRVFEVASERAARLAATDPTGTIVAPVRVRCGSVSRP